MNNEIIKSEKNKLQAENSIKNLNDMLFSQLNDIMNLDVTDNNFHEKKDKVLVFAEVADRIIRNNEFMLKVKVWNSHQKFRITSRGYDE